MKSYNLLICVDSFLFLKCDKSKLQNEPVLPKSIKKNNNGMFSIFRFVTDFNHVHTEVTNGDTEVDVTQYSSVLIKEYLSSDLDSTARRTVLPITM